LTKGKERGEGKREEGQCTETKVTVSRPSDSK